MVQRPGGACLSCWPQGMLTPHLSSTHVLLAAIQQIFMTHVPITVAQGLGMGFSACDPCLLQTSHCCGAMHLFGFFLGLYTATQVI